MLWRKKVRISLGFRLVVLILLATLSVSAVTVAIGYQIYRNSSERRYIQLGQNLARTIKNVIEGDSLDRFLSDGVTDQEYENALRLIRNIQKENIVQNLYVVRLAGEGGWYFIYDAPEETPLGYLDPFDNNYPEFKKQALAGVISPIISKTQWGWLLSVYEPIHNSKGELIGYVGADFDMKEIVWEHRSYLLRLLFIAFLITVVFAILYILMIHKTVVQPINTMAKAADRYLAPEDETAPSSSIAALDIHTNDELESLAEAMKSMDLEINHAIVGLKKAEIDAQTASLAKTAFLAQMSHELRTPMNAIMGMARAVLYEAGNQEKVTQALKQIITSSQRLLTNLNDILDISNIESGKLVLSKDVFSMSEVCQSLNDLTRLQCKSKKLAFFSDTSQVENIIVRGDRVRLMQAAGAILSNAVKFTEEGGEIRFVVTVKDQTLEKIRVCFLVSDTGIGISPEQQKMLFQAFVPVDKEVSVKYGGIGARLSICKRLVEMMGGSIKVESEAGKGSFFSFEIIIDKADAKEMEITSAIEKQPEDMNFSGKKILVVDDIKTNRAVVGIILKNTGADIIEAKDGMQALEIVSKLARKIDLILMDISMPNMDGYEATRAIRALDTDWAKTIPIIALTAHTYQEDVEAALEAGMDFHLEKPVNFDILLSTVARYL
ncbi:MAG: response regulator [Synergistaceae bacterium]|jgi:signal transduction histidine kinase/CheY-like chemotaxis protein|nr:response regulator [Synergistaceae bacterium]